AERLDAVEIRLRLERRVLDPRDREPRRNDRIPRRVERTPKVLGDLVDAGTQIQRVSHASDACLLTGGQEEQEEDYLFAVTLPCCDALRAAVPAVYPRPILRSLVPLILL